MLAHLRVDDPRALLGARPGAAERVQLLVRGPALVYVDPARIEQVGAQREVEAALGLPRPFDDNEALVEVAVTVGGLHLEVAGGDQQGGRTAAVGETQRSGVGAPSRAGGRTRRPVGPLSAGRVRGAGERHR